MTSFLSRALLRHLHPRSSYLDPPCIFDFLPPTSQLGKVSRVNRISGDQDRGGWWLGVSIKLFSYPAIDALALDYTMMGLPCPAPLYQELISNSMPNQMNTMAILIKTTTLIINLFWLLIISRMSAQTSLQIQEEKNKFTVVFRQKSAAKKLAHLNTSRGRIQALPCSMFVSFISKVLRGEA